MAKEAFRAAESYQIKLILQLIEQYKKENRMAEVYAATREVISPNTLRNWLSNPDRASRAYKANALLRVRDKLPDLKDAKKFDAFSFALEEFGLDRSSQQGLQEYHGVYVVYHRFMAEGFDKFVIAGRTAPRFATFWFRFQSAGKAQVCDGLVVMRPSRLYFVGLAKGSMFFGHLKTVTNPKRDILFGVGLFEDFRQEKLSVSKIALVDTSRKISSAELEYINHYVADAPLILI